MLSPDFPMNTPDAGCQLLTGRLDIPVTTQEAPENREPIMIEQSDRVH